MLVTRNGKFDYLAPVAPLAESLECHFYGCRVQYAHDGTRDHITAAIVSTTEVLLSKVVLYLSKVDCQTKDNDPEYLTIILHALATVHAAEAV